VNGNPHRAFQPDVIRLDEVDARVSEVLAHMTSRGVVVSRPQVIRSGQRWPSIAEPVLGGRNNQEVVAALWPSFRFKRLSCSSTAYFQKRTRTPGCRTSRCLRY
jgi:hypothetical protein